MRAGARCRQGAASLPAPVRVARRRCSTAASEEPPSYLQLFRHARLAAVPMVGFGFMDNIIMIQAGDLIDSTLGVTLGLSTLTAAALGNVCSDTSGCLFGGIVESASERLNLPGPAFTPSQAKMRVVRYWGTGGAIIGVMCGCFLGMTQLFVIDLERSERLKKAAELETIFKSVMENGHTLLGCERVTLYLFDPEKNELVRTRTPSIQ